ncbi:MAG: FprA family A-type flavoprotein [Faecalibacterium sp.]
MVTLNNSTAIFKLGVDDISLDLFESQYPVPNGVSYNSYLILDEKIAVMDTVDPRATEAWLANLTEALAGQTPDYLVVSHMEPDHAASIGHFVARYPAAKIVGNAKTFAQMQQFFPGVVDAEKKHEVKEGDVLTLGTHSLTFVMAPMVHWPEVMVAYEASEKILFSADAFGKFGALSHAEEWAAESRRYFINIVGKYGLQVQGLLKKAAGLDIATICPLHGPVLEGAEIAQAVALYQMWSSYQAENPQEIFLAYASIHGNTKAAALHLAERLRAKGAAVTTMDLCRTDVSYAVAEAFRCGKLVLATATYDASIFPPMEAFLHHLKSKNFQKRTIALVENGTWAPMAAKIMRAECEGFKQVDILPEIVTIRSVMNAESVAQMEVLADILTAKE